MSGNGRPVRPRVSFRRVVCNGRVFSSSGAFALTTRRTHDCLASWAGRPLGNVFACRTVEMLIDGAPQHATSLMAEQFDGSANVVSLGSVRLGPYFSGIGQQRPPARQTSASPLRSDSVDFLHLDAGVHSHGRFLPQKSQLDPNLQ